MGNLITLSICLSDIPKERIKQTESGKKYMNVCVVERREPDKYDNTLSVYMQQTKEERDWKREKQYIGAGKVYIFGGTPEATSPEAVESLPVAEEVDDLPF